MKAKVFNAGTSVSNARAVKIVVGDYAKHGNKGSFNFIVSFPSVKIGGVILEILTFRSDDGFEFQNFKPDTAWLLAREDRYCRMSLAGTHLDLLSRPGIYNPQSEVIVCSGESHSIDRS